MFLVYHAYRFIEERWIKGENGNASPYCSRLLV